MNPQPPTSPDANDIVVLPSGKELVIPKAYPTEKRQALIGAAIDFDSGQAQKRVAAPFAENPIVGGVAQTYKDIRGAVSTGLRRLDDATSPLSPGTRQKLGIPTFEGANPMPVDLTSGVAQTATGAVGGKADLPGAVRRVTAGAIGGEVGGAFDGRSPGMGAIEGGGGALIGEITGKGAELARRAWTHLTGGLYRQDAVAVGKALGELSPVLKGATTEQELRDLVISGKGRQKLFEQLETAYGEIEKKLGDRVLFIPAMMKSRKTAATLPGATKSVAAPTDTHEPPYPVGASDTVYGSIPRLSGSQPTTGPMTAIGNEPYASTLSPTAAGRRVSVTVPPSRGDRVYSDGDGVTFTAVRAELRDLYKKGWGREDLSAQPSATAQAAQDRFKLVMAQLKSELPADVAPQFVEARRDFRVGMGLIDVIRKANGPSNRLFQAGTDGASFQTNRLQQYLSANETKLRARLGDEEYSKLADVAFRGAKPGAGDTQGISLGTFVDRTHAPLSGGAIIERFPTLSIPSYTGSPKPFQTTAGAQLLLDLLGQKAASGAVRLNPPPDVQ